MTGQSTNHGAFWAVLLVLAAALAGCTDVEDDDNGDGGDREAAARIATLEGRIAELEAMTAPPTYAPVPAAANGPAIGSKGYLVQEIGEGSGLYWLTDGAYQIMFLTTGVGVIVVDAPPSMAANIMTAVAEVTSEPITHLIYSHSHADHIAGAGELPSGITVIAHEATAAALARDHPSEPEFPFGTFVGGGPVPAPTVTFSDDYTLTVGSQTLELHDLGPAHEEGNLFIYAPAHKVLLVIDVFFPGWVPFLGLALTEDIPAYIAAHDHALDFEFETLIAGHLGRLGTRADVQMQRDYVEDVRQNALTALQSVDFNAIAADVGFANPWVLFGSYLGQLADHCAELTEADWVGVLGGADVFTHSHCDRMVESLRID